MARGAHGPLHVALHAQHGLMSELGEHVRVVVRGGRPVGPRAQRRPRQLVQVAGPLEVVQTHLGHGASRESAGEEHQQSEEALMQCPVKTNMENRATLHTNGLLITSTTC